VFYSKTYSCFTVKFTGVLQYIIVNIPQVPLHAQFVNYSSFGFYIQTSSFKWFTNTKSHIPFVLSIWNAKLLWPWKHRCLLYLWLSLVFFQTFAYFQGNNKAIYGFVFEILHWAKTAFRQHYIGTVALNFNSTSTVSACVYLSNKGKIALFFFNRTSLQIFLDRTCT